MCFFFLQVGDEVFNPVNVEKAIEEIEQNFDLVF